MARVLIVEDDLILCNMLRRLLEKEGWNTAGVASVEQALAELARCPFDLVVTDYLLATRHDGLCLLAHLKEAGCRPPAIVMSGAEKRDLPETACKLGAVAFLSKPFDIEIFLSLCRKAVQNNGQGQGVGDDCGGFP